MTFCTHVAGSCNSCLTETLPDGHCSCFDPNLSYLNKLKSLMLEEALYKRIISCLIAVVEDGTEHSSGE